MLSAIKNKLINQLWLKFYSTVPNCKLLFNNQLPILDHLAIIDIKSKNTGISVLKQIFKKLGFIQRGKGYIPQKANDFIWMADVDSIYVDADKSLPQIVLADFRNELLSAQAQAIISNYIQNIESFNFQLFDERLVLAKSGNSVAADDVIFMIENYLSSRPWPQPTASEYKLIMEENELLAWVFLFGRKVNHFGLSVHLMDMTPNLSKFNQHLSRHDHIKFNNINGVIKGSKKLGIEQTSSQGRKLKIAFGNEIIEARDCFMEFVWRHPVKPHPHLWCDYFTDFLPTNANTIIESLYTKFE